MAVPVLDLKAQYQRIRQAIDDAVRGVLESGLFVLGPNVRALEEELASFLGVARAIALASGTDALHLTIHALGIGAGDLVLTSPFTFVATATAISYTGARPVFADIHPATFTLDPDRAAEYLAGTGPGPRPEGRVKAILPIHLYGLPADMDPLLHLARQHRLRVVEDAAQAIGSEYRGRRVGGLGDAGCFSFYPTKNLGALGDGGMVVTSDPGIAGRLRMLRNYGEQGKYNNIIEGINSRLDELQAAILRVKLRHLDGWNEKRRGLAREYDIALNGSPLVLPNEKPGCRHVYHLYVVRHPERDRL
ncbi:MAG TPA: erythromycin biosynthesis sensory transduction protein eryC1, partial [Elusimicrobia bacterium]|nr:erythromycin biosynthesis sensory transduction protein eryC1 [Elusimicrobiota bacterium]